MQCIWISSLVAWQRLPWEKLLSGAPDVVTEIDGQKAQYTRQIRITETRDSCKLSRPSEKGAFIHINSYLMSVDWLCFSYSATRGVEEVSVPRWTKAACDSVRSSSDHQVREMTSMKGTSLYWMLCRFWLNLQRRNNEVSRMMKCTKTVHQLKARP